jgi:hypothetical protein
VIASERSSVSLIDAVVEAAAEQGIIRFDFDTDSNGEK